MFTVFICIKAGLIYIQAGTPVNIGYYNRITAGAHLDAGFHALIRTS